MSFSFIEIGDTSCSYHSFDVTQNSKIILDNSVELNIESCNKPSDNFLHITTSKYINDFGSHFDMPLNYFYLNLYIDTSLQSNNILLGSSIVYGYNKEESYVDTLKQALVHVDFYNILKERFDIAFNGDEKYLAIFLNHMFNNCEDTQYMNVFESLKKLINLSYPLKQMCKPLETVSLDTKYNWMIVRTTSVERNFLEEMLIAVLESYNQNVDFVHEDDVNDLTYYKDVDIFIVITSDESQEYEYPSNSYLYKTPDSFYQSSRRLLRQIPKIVEWSKTKDLPDRSIVQIKDVSSGGCGSNCSCFSKSSTKQSCCEEEKKELNTCCQGKETGCCKDPNATDEDKSMCGTGNCSGGCLNK